MLTDKIIYSCSNAACHEPIHTGRCKDECWRIYRGEKNQKPTDSFAYWRHRGANNDFIWCECSNCGFRVEAYYAVKLGTSSTDYVDVKYKFCPICGKEMRV